MTPNERRDELRAELAALGTREDDITFRLLDRVDHYTRAVDLDCMRAVDEILALRDQVAACRTIIEASDREIDRLRGKITEAWNGMDEIRCRLTAIRDDLPQVAEVMQDGRRVQAMLSEGLEDV